MKKATMDSLGMAYIGDAAFGKLLQKMGCEITVPELRAFLMGCILCDEIVMPNQAMQLILEDRESNDEPFKNEKDAIKFFSSFMGLWNEMADYQFSKEPFRFSKLKKTFASDDDCKAAIADRIAEMCIFLDGFLQDGGDEGYEYDPDNPDVLPLAGQLDVSIQSLVEQMEALNSALDRGILSAMVEAVDERFEKTLKKHLKKLGKGPGASSPKPKKSSH